MLRLAVGALFVGNQACAPCHDEILPAYAATGMANSSGRIDGVVISGSLQHKASRVRYSSVYRGKWQYPGGCDSCAAPATEARR